MWATQMLGTFALFITCYFGKQVTETHRYNNNTDSFVLFKKDTLVIIGALPAEIKCEVSKNTAKAFNGQHTTLLILENVKLLSMPEGVYEIYINHQPPQINTPVSSQSGFVALLDLYSLTAPGAKLQLEVDVSQQFKQVLLQKQRQPILYVSIRFSPIKLADGNYSTQAGKLCATGISIVQIEKDRIIK